MTEIIQSFCPLCSGYKFSAHRGRENSRCDGCGSLERHRLLFFLALEIMSPGERVAFIEDGYRIPQIPAKGLSIENLSYPELSISSDQKFDLIISCDSISADKNLIDVFTHFEASISDGGKVIMLILADPKKLETDAGGFGCDTISYFNSVPNWDFESIPISSSKEHRMKNEMRSAKVFSENQRGYIPLTGWRTGHLS